MGRFKFNIKKIENSTRSQITYSKRRNGLIKKAQEISVLCGVAIAVVTFSTSGRITHFPKRKRLAEVVDRYNNLPLDMRDSSIEDTKSFFEQLGHIRDDSTKIILVNNQIKRLQRQISISKVEIQIIEAQLRSFNSNQSKEFTTSCEVRWQENYLMDMLIQVRERKEFLYNKAKILQLVNFEVAMERDLANNFATNIDPSLPVYRPQRNLFGSSVDVAIGIPIHYHLQAVNNGHVLNNQLVSNYSSWNQFDPQFQPVQQGMVNYGISPLVPNQQLGFMARSSSRSQGMVTSDMSLPVQPPRAPYDTNMGRVISDIPSAVGPSYNTNMIRSLDRQRESESPIMFDSGESKWFTNFMRKDFNNFSTEPSISPRVSSSSSSSSSSLSIYNSTGTSSHVDPFLRVYELNNNNNPDANISSNSVQNQQNLSNKEEPWAQFQASPPSVISRIQIENHEDMQNHYDMPTEVYPLAQFEASPPYHEDVQNHWDKSTQEDPRVKCQAPPPSDLPIIQIHNHEEVNSSFKPTPPSDLSKFTLQLDDIRFEDDMNWDDILKTPKNQEDNLMTKELFSPDIWINLEELGIFSE